MTIKCELLDELLKDYKKPEDMLWENGILKQLTKALLERALQGEMTHTSATPSMPPKVTIPATAATENPRRPSRATMALCLPYRIDLEGPIPDHCENLA